MTLDPSPWHPVACSADLRAGDNIVAGFACGQELALWRAADGAAQAWENRCPHRSVRFTLGQVVGDRLSCAYHGWQYAAGTGQCAGIPAHPAMPPPRNVCARTFRAHEAAGMLWVNLGPQDAASEPPPSLARAVPAGWSYGRAVAVRAGAGGVREALARRHFARDAIAPSWCGQLDGVPVAALVLEARTGLTFLHLWTRAVAGSAEMRTLHAAARHLRDAIEAS